MVFIIPESNIEKSDKKDNYKVVDHHWEWLVTWTIQECANWLRSAKLSKRFTQTNKWKVLSND